jgi:uncharacterized membrane protein YagU involved in acid resistance
LVTTLPDYKEALFVEKKYTQPLQQLLMCIALIGMLYYAYSVEFKMATISVIPWVWGFLAGRIFCFLKKSWCNELFGLGILLAITIVLFFKQTEIIKLLTEAPISDIATVIHLSYISVGFVLGMIFWSRSSSTAKD